MRTKLLILSLVLTTACDQGSDTPQPERSAELVPTTDDASEARPLATLRAVDEGTDIRELARTIEPKRTRAGFLRFTTSAVHDPSVAEVFIERLTDGHETPQVRAALVEALPRTGGDYADALLRLYADERDAGVRVAMVGAFRRAPGAQAREGILVGLEDGDAEVRAEAARVAGARPEVADLEEALAQRVDDHDAAVRAASIRSLGLLGATARVESVADGLRDGDASVRLEAIRALRRIDPDGVSVRVHNLTDDDDEIVRNAAQRLTR